MDHGSSIVARRLALVAGCTLLILSGTAVAQSRGIRGSITYNGTRTPVGPQRPLCLCVYIDPQLHTGLGCFIFFSNPASYQFNTFDTNDYYLIAFVDPDRTETLTAGEPYEIYRDRAAPPADPITASLGFTQADFVFGDENVPPQATATPLPTATPSPRVCAGDCDSSGDISIDELITMVTIALGLTDLGACRSADRDANGTIDVTDLIAAVNQANSGCSG